MQLLIINGSPKLNISNTGVMIEGFKKHIHGFNPIHVATLNQTPDDKLVEQIKEADHIVIAMPLYGYAMPAQVLNLLQRIYDSSNALAGKSYGFIIQYGFIEAIHARPLERYFIDFVETIQGEYLGTIIKGGCDSLYNQINSKQSRLILDGISRIGEAYSQDLVFDTELVKTYSLPESQEKKANKFMMKMMVFFANKFYWKKKFNKNGVTEKESFAKPYA